MNYPEAIKRLRHKMILTQTEFAKMLGVSFGLSTDGNLESMNQQQRQKENLLLFLKNIVSRWKINEIFR